MAKFSQRFSHTSNGIRRFFLDSLSFERGYTKENNLRVASLKAFFFDHKAGLRSVFFFFSSISKLISVPIACMVLLSGYQVILIRSRYCYLMRDIAQFMKRNYLSLCNHSTASHANCLQTIPSFSGQCIEFSSTSKDCFLIDRYLENKQTATQ